MIDHPTPAPGPLDVLSPTAANDLLMCGYRLAWRLDRGFRSLRRPTPWSELGVVAHAVVEDVARGLLRHVTGSDEARSTIEDAWDSHLDAAVQDLKKAWAPATPPPPEEWPGYHLVRARILRRAMRGFDAERSGRPAELPAVQVEEAIGIRRLRCGVARTGLRDLRAIAASST